MSALNAALQYAACGCPVFPCNACKVPLTPHGFRDATTGARQIESWWTRYPYALPGLPTGERTGLAVLDIDRKKGRDGLRSLARLLDTEELPVTPTVQTPTGGYHLHFLRSEGGFRNTVGAAGRGICDGLDWRCDGGYVVLPAPGTGYRWAANSYENCTPITVPEALLPRPLDREPDLNARYGTGTGNHQLDAITINSLSGVARCLQAATEGERNALLFWSACRFGEAIARGLISGDDAHRILTEAASHLGLPDHEIARTINSAFGRTGQ
jgi:hypothetical protein